MPFAFSTEVCTTIEDIEHIVAQIPDSSLVEATALVLRIDATLWLHLMSDLPSAEAALSIQSKAISMRAPQVDVYALQDGHSCAVGRPPFSAKQGPRLLFRSDGRGVAFTDAVSEDVVRAIREEDLSRYVSDTRSRCVICANDKFHFALPSGAHSSQFLRLSEAFVDIANVDRIAYWIAHRIENELLEVSTESELTLLVDHPSMLVLASRVIHMVSRPLAIATFPSYPSDIESRTSTFAFLNRIASSNSALFLVVGVASTGRLARFVDAWAADRSALKVHSTILYAVEAFDGPAPLCRIELPDYQHYASKEACRLCEKGSVPVEVRSTNYMFGQSPAEEIPLTSNFFEAQREFLDRWGRHEGVLRIHYDDPNETTARHHGFYIDVGTLLRIEGFRLEVEDWVSSLEPPPEMILVPDHPAACLLADLISKSSGIPSVLLKSEILRANGPLFPNPSNVQSLLVADDVFISGAQLDRINRYLRETKLNQFPALTNIKFFTPLAIPASERSYASRLRGLTSRHGWNSSVKHLYRFPLPDWHDYATCPWCRERAVLARLAKGSDLIEGQLIDRLAHLSLTSGLMENPFCIHSSIQSLPNLGQESAILPGGAAPLQVLFACASAVQQLRHAPGKALDSAQFPTPTGLAKRVFESNYSERMVWLGLLRSLRSSELHSDLQSFLRSAAIDKADAQQGVLHGEMAIAWLSGKLGSLDTSAAGKEFFESLDIAWESLYNAAFVDVK